MPFSDNSDGPWGPGGKKKGTGKRESSPWGSSGNGNQPNGSSGPKKVLVQGQKLTIS